MHRCSQRNRPLISFDPKIEATARRQSDVRKRQQAQIVMVERDPRVLRDYVLPQATGIASSIANSTAEANNFELRSALVFFVEKDQFGGHPTGNPHIHLRNFLEKCDTIKLNGICNDAIKLWLFPFLLTDRASD